MKSGFGQIWWRSCCRAFREMENHGKSGWWIMAGPIAPIVQLCRCSAGTYTEQHHVFPFSSICEDKIDFVVCITFKHNVLITVTMMIWNDSIPTARNALSFKHSVKYECGQNVRNYSLCGKLVSLNAVTLQRITSCFTQTSLSLLRVLSPGDNTALYNTPLRPVVVTMGQQEADM